MHILNIEIVNLTMAKQKYNLKNFNLSPNRKIGKWTLAKRIGAGGNGEVWICRNKQKQEYAIKFLKWGSGDAYKRFFDEVTFMEQFGSIHGVMPIIDKYIPEYSKRMDNPNLPFYYVMPLAESAEKHLSQINVDEKIAIIQELLAMLTSLHAQGIAHRDIKPANILLYNGCYVLSDFGLVFFNKKTAKTPVGTKLGAKWTISPQMERDAVHADKFKSDVYSMAKTIWMILTGDIKSFEGQYKPNSVIGLRQYISKEKYLYPLEKLLEQCTDYNENSRPDAAQLEKRFAEWIFINNSWSHQNLLQWQEVQEQLFPTTIPAHAEWHNIKDIVSVLQLLGQYNSQNHTFFPDGGGLDLTGANLSYEKDCIELHCDGLVYVVKPKKLSFEFINSKIEWTYFYLEAEPLKAFTPNYPKDLYSEEFCEISPLNYKPLSLLDNMSKEDFDKIHPRHITRYLRGSFVIFHKDSIYNHFVSKYKGEHEELGMQEFRKQISILATKYKGETMITIRERLENQKKA